MEDRSTALKPPSLPAIEIDQLPRNSSQESVPSSFTRIVKVPAVSFFILCTMWTTAMQLKTSFQLDLNPIGDGDLAPRARSLSFVDEPLNPLSKEFSQQIIDLKNTTVGEIAFVERVNAATIVDILNQYRTPTIERSDIKNTKYDIHAEAYEATTIDTAPPIAEVQYEMIEEHTLQEETIKPIKNRVLRKRKTRVIFGIMTYDSQSERKRRGLIRSTFLSYFKTHMNRTLVSDDEYNKKKHWICSLNDLDHGRVEHPEKCRMAYAFVQGANPNGTTMLLNFNETYPISLPPPKNQTKSEKKDASDTVYLNIQENGRFGKSPTWFRYAIDVLERHGWMNEFDYIFKSDTDNLIYTPNFFRFMDKLPKKRAIRVFGGRPLDYEKCGGDSHDHCKEMVGPLFMAGGCYFLSLDLAKFISDETTFDHQAVKLPHEDMTTGNFVYSHPQSIRIVKEPRHKGVIRTHPVKKTIAFEHRWNKMLREEQARLLDGMVS